MGGPGGPQWGGGPRGGQWGGPAMPHRSPPPDAFEACSDKKAGDDCVIARGEWEMKGSCSALPEQEDHERLVCAPKGGKDRGKAARGRPKASK